MGRLSTAGSASPLANFVDEIAYKIRVLRRRKNFFVDPEYQRRIMRHVLTIVTVGIALGAFNVLVVEHYSGFLHETYGAIAEVGAIVLVATGLYLLLWLGLSLATIHVLLVLFSHRIAGPEYKLRMILEEMRGGNLDLHVRLRKHDFLQDLALELNLTARCLHAWSEELDASLGALRSALEKGDAAEAALRLDAAQAALRGLRRGGDARPRSPAPAPAAVPLAAQGG